MEIIYTEHSCGSPLFVQHLVDKLCVCVYILKKYIKLYDLYCSQDNSLIDLGNYFHLEKDSHYAHIIYTYGDDYLMMGSLNLFTPTTEIIALCKDIFKTVKLYENNFFINVK